MQYLEKINNALIEYHERTCIIFRLATSKDKDYVKFLSGASDSGCFSRIGRVGGEQIINLESAECDTGNIVHEIMHALGFWHQQSAPNRDEYVRIVEENINKTFSQNFNKFGYDFVTSFGIEYDYGSIMHYDPKAFSENGLPTITALVS